MGLVPGVAVVAAGKVDVHDVHGVGGDAAERSRFNRSDSAPDPQKGSIVYRFIAQ